MYGCYSTLFSVCFLYAVMRAGAAAAIPGAELGIGTCPETPGKGGSVTLLSFKTGSWGAGGGRYKSLICSTSLPGSTGLI